MKFRPTLVICAFLLGCAGNSSGNLGGSNGAGASSSSASGTGGAPGTSSGTGGMPGTTGGTGGTGGDPYNTPPTCSSMKMALAVNDASMIPGSACKSCHVPLGPAPTKTFDVSGTVYKTAHEPDNCNGVNVSGAVVIITDATKVETQIPINAVGNFFHDDLAGVAALKTPLHARVVYNGKTRAMMALVTTGDCNSCHTEAGTTDAPGRIMLP